MPFMNHLSRIGRWRDCPSPRIGALTLGPSVAPAIPPGGEMGSILLNGPLAGSKFLWTERCISESKYIDITLVYPRAQLLLQSNVHPGCSTWNANLSR